jgi:hypothetical protein
MKEKDICKAFYKQYQIMKAYNQFSNDAFVFHIANEQNCNKFYTMELKRMGLTAGIPDYCVIAKQGKMGFLEAKRNDKCKLSESQQKFKEVCESLDISYLVFWNSDDAIKFIQNI